jgi:hypothetical protein
MSRSQWSAPEAARARGPGVPTHHLERAAERAFIDATPELRGPVRPPRITRTISAGERPKRSPPASSAMPRASARSGRMLQHGRPRDQAA